MKEITFATLEEFQDFMQKSSRTMVMIHAPNCVACDELETKLDKLGLTYGVKIFKLDATANQTHADIENGFGLEIYPSLFFINHGPVLVGEPGNPPFLMIGSRSDKSLKKFIKAFVESRNKDMSSMFLDECASCKKYKLGFCTMHRIRTEPVDTCHSYKPR